MINLYNDDCIKVMDELIDRGTKVNAVIADLPYYQVVDDDWDNAWKSESEYLSWVEAVAIRIAKLVDDGNIILFTGRQYNRKICTILDRYFTEKRIIIWERKRMFNNTRGKSLTSGYEPICYYSKGNAPFNMIKVRPKTKRKEYTNGVLRGGVCLSDVWNDIKALPHNAPERVAHPTQKPIKLMRRCVEMFTNIGDTVLDCTMGSGSTGVACKESNRHFIGIELDEVYFNIAKTRIKKSRRLF